MRKVEKKNESVLRNVEVWRPPVDRMKTARTEMVGTPFLREVSTDLGLDSGSSLTLSFSLLSSTGESRWTADREALRETRERG